MTYVEGPMSDEAAAACTIDHGRDKDGKVNRAQASAGLLCQRHADRLWQWLNDILIDYAMLPAQLAPIKSTTDYSTDKRGGSDEAAAPLNLAVAALRDAERGGAPRPRGEELWYELPDIPSVLSALHNRAEDLRCELDPARDHNGTLRGVTVTGEINYLLCAFAHLCAVAWIDETFTEIKGLWIALQRAHNRPRPRPVGECLTLDCGGTVWPREEAAPWCSNCHRVYSSDAEIIKVRLEAEKRSA